MQRSGPRIELDVKSTISKLYRDGVLVGPLFRERRRNLASVVILLDVGGSIRSIVTTFASCASRRF